MNGRATYILAAAAIAGLVAAGCGDAPPTSARDAGAVQALGADVERAEAAATDPQVQELAAAQTAFATDLYHAVRDRNDEDLVVAPTSLHTVLSMVRAGARASTAKEMDAVLHTTDLADLHDSANALDTRLRRRDRAHAVDLEVANRIWVQHGLGLTEDYVRTVSRDYGAGLAVTDFVGNPQAARQAINRWVAERTRDRIEELFKTDELDANTRMVLTNAVFLDAAWQLPFDPKRTSDEPFTLPSGSRVTVATMHYDEYLPSAFGDDWAAVELPYDGKDLSMVVIVPDDLETFEERLDPTTLTGILAEIEDGGIHLSLPRFTARERLNLNSTLAAMGMASAFGPGADFSGMTGRADLWIQTVVHEAVVEVDEKGTEAAAASGAGMMGSHGPTITVDRPFLFLIRDEPTGAVLFLGRVTDPR